MPLTVPSLLLTNAGYRLVYFKHFIKIKNLATDCTSPALGLSQERNDLSMRQLKHHEQKLLKKVDFLNVRAVWCLLVKNVTDSFKWKQDASLREVKVMRRYHIQDREDYHK